MKIYEMLYQLSVQNNRRWFPSYTKSDLNCWNSFIKQMFKSQTCFESPKCNYRCIARKIPKTTVISRQLVYYHSLLVLVLRKLPKSPTHVYSRWYQNPLSRSSHLYTGCNLENPHSTYSYIDHGSPKVEKHIKSFVIQQPYHNSRESFARTQKQGKALGSLRMYLRLSVLSGWTLNIQTKRNNG